MRGDEARRWVAGNFTVRKMCEKTVALYETLLLRKGSSSATR
jgi:hypothetical protein